MCGSVTAAAGPDERIAIAALDRDQRGEDRCWEARVIEIDREIFAARARSSSGQRRIRRFTVHRKTSIIRSCTFCEVVSCGRRISGRFASAALCIIPGVRTAALAAPRP
jgi:hypothetical protein